VALWAFVVIAVLVAVLLVPNGVYAFRQFLAHRNLLWLTAYFFFLFLLGYLLLYVSRRTVELVQAAKEVYEEPGP
jgi:peptidoglycan/LPS O-acetylase OafA/YrhL